MDFSDVSDGEMISTTLVVDKLNPVKNLDNDYFACNVTASVSTSVYIDRGMSSLALILFVLVSSIFIMFY